MHAAAHGLCEDLCGRHGGLPRSHGEPEAEKAAPGESFGRVKRQAAIAICARTADTSMEESVEIAREIGESGTAGGDGTQGPLTHLRLTAGAAELVWTSECMRGALPAVAGARARAVVLPCLRAAKPYRGA